MKKKVLSLALALALCLGLTVPASAAEKKSEAATTNPVQPVQNKKPQTINFGSTQITNVIYYGDYLDAAASNLPGLPIICRITPEIRALVTPEWMVGQTEQAFNEGDESYLEVRNIGTLDDEVIYHENSKFVLDEPGTYVISISYPEDDSENYDDGNGGNVADSFLITVLGPSEMAPSKDPFHPFSDVPATSPYSDGVKWATKTKVTAGKTANSFGPNDVCTVSHILTFLYRAYTMYDETEISGSEREAVLAWAKENGLLDNGQNLDAPCTRAMAVTFMWKASGCPEAYVNSSFSDISENAEYKQAVNWAVEREITSGTGDGSTFSPNNTCTRGQIVTFLFRDMFDGGF